MCGLNELNFFFFENGRLLVCGLHEQVRFEWIACGFHKLDRFEKISSIVWNA